MTFESSYHVRVKTLYKALGVRHCQGSKNEKQEKQTKKPAFTLTKNLWSIRGLHVHLIRTKVNDNNSKINT